MMTEDKLKEKIKKETKNWKRHYFKFGLSSKKYYIIRREAHAAGLFSVVNTHLGEIAYALNRGYIPVVDMQNYENCYLSPEEMGMVNAWDRLFEQPCGVTVDEAYRGRCVILSDGNPLPSSQRPDDDWGFFRNKEGRLDYWRDIAHRYLKVNSLLLEEINKEYKELVSQEDRVLGVLVRGTDYVEKAPREHPVQPSPSMVIKKAHELMDEYHCNKIFVATEDSNIAKLFKDEFGEKYITNSRDFVQYKEGAYLPTISIDRENDCYLKGREYLTTIVMLSKSKVLLGGRTSGTVGAMLLSDGFEYSHMFDLGRYGIEEDW